jgi:thiol-disulfide isomerase/thioredoxin
MVLRFSSIIMLLTAIWQNDSCYAQINTSVIEFDSLEQKFNRPSDTLHIYNFWATWCKPCVEELPYLSALKRKLNGVHIELILVSLDFKSHYQSRVIPFVHKHNITERVLLLDAGDPNKWIDRVDPSWSGAIPATLFTYKNKRLFVEKHYESTSDIEIDIHSLIK